MAPHSLAGELKRRAIEQGDRVGIRVSDGGDLEAATPLRWSELWEQARRVAAGLRDRGLGAGDRVLVLAPETSAAVAAHFGAWALAATPIHVGLPYRLADPAGFIAQLHLTADRLSARALLVSRSVAPFIPAGDRRAVAVEDLLAANLPGDADPDRAPPPDLVQLTSGSTGRPRAVVIPHRRLVAHLEAIRHALPAGEDASVVSWLPLFHDMGLIGGLLYPFVCDAPVHLLSPLVFQTQPFAWLRALSDDRATHTVGPPSAYALLLRLARRAVEAGLRLDRLRCAMIGAEPISADLLRAFAAAFARCGFREPAFFPVYGLAEATVAVTFPRQLEPPALLELDPAALQDRRRAAPPSGPARTLVGVGAPLAGTEVRIVDAAGAALADGSVGQILVRAATLMDRYDGEPEATAAALVDGWLHTGDLGLLSGGRLFVTGRAKDIIIKGGHNLYPEPIETVAASVDGVRAGCVVAFGIYSERHQSERIHVIAESRRALDEWPLLCEAIRAALKIHGVAVDEVQIVAPGTLPKTTSGKLRRAEAAARWTASKA